MAKYIVEFSPPEKIKKKLYDDTDSVLNYRILLAPFQKQTRVEFSNVKFKEFAIRYLTVVNPLEKSGQFILPPPGDGVYFNMYKFNLEPNSECELTITWQPSEYGKMRKLVRIEQVDNNRKYDFVILGNCISPHCMKSKGATTPSSKNENSSFIKRQIDCDKKNITSNKTKYVSSVSEKITSSPVKLPKPICEETLLSPVRRQTYLVREKENLPISKNKVLCRDTILTSPEHSIKRPDKKCQDQCFNSHFDESLENSFKLTVNHYSQLDDFTLTPLQSTENLLSTFSTEKQLNSSDDISNVSITFTPIKNKATNDYCHQFIKSSEIELNKTFISSGSDNIDSVLYSPLPEVKQFSGSKSKHEWTDEQMWTDSAMLTFKKKLLFTNNNSSHYKYSPKTMKHKNKLKQYSASLQTTFTKASKQDKCDQYLKCLTNPELLYHSFTEDPFLKMSQYFEVEWLNRQESDMIRWINALLTPTDKLVDEEQSGDLEQAAIAWIEASKMSNENKPMLLATQKDLFAAQIYRQSPQQWKALRKATTNLFTSTSVAPVLSKLTLLIEKDLITVRDDRQIHLDLSLKKKITDLLKCYNPLWLRIGLEAIYGQIVHVKSGSSDLDGVGWFVRKHLLNNDYVKKKFTKTTILQVNLPTYNTAMKKFILRKIFMLLYFLDRAKEQQLIRHNPCLFKIDSSHKSSYDLLMEFCADMVAAHGDIIRRLRSIGYNLNHKQTHLDEVNYAVNSLNDLRDGIRITRVVEILFKGSPLSHKLRLPAISKLQKIHNVSLAFTRISEHISIEGNINSRDIVNGHREKMLSLFWQIIYKYLTPRYNYAATKIQNWWRNSSLKLVVLKRIRAKEITKRHTAATKVQALTRGYFMRKQWPHIKTELIKNQKMLNAASTKIKHYLKNKLKLLTNERKRFVILRRTVILIQRKFRAKLMMVKERQNYLKLKQSVLTIQKYYRGFILRKNLPLIRKNMIAEKTTKIVAINVIKHVLRRNLPLTEERIKYIKLRQCVLYVQRLFLAKKTMKMQLEHFTILKSTTVFVQQKFRANIAMQKDRKTFLKTKLSIVLIQKTFRGFIVRKNWPNLQNYLMMEKKKHINAINTLKRALRQNLPPTQDRLNFLKLKNTVIYIEVLYLANKSMNIQMNHYKALKRATLFVQIKFKANIIMKRERHHFVKIKQSVLLIQKVFRGFIVRKHWPDMKSCLITERKKQIKAANIVKQALRRNLPATQDRLNFAKLKSAVMFVQRKWRANKLMKIQSDWYTKCHYATVLVQKKFRAIIFMQKEQKNYFKIKSAALLIQKVYRGYVIRKNWPSLKLCLMSDKIKRAHATDVIKRVLRHNLPPTQDRLYYKQLRRSTVTIQRRFRANIEMKVQRDKYLMLKRSAVVLQQRYLAKRAMNTKRSWYTRLKTYAIRLQTAIRGYLVRKHWPELRAQLQVSRLILIQKADMVKRTLRKHLPPTEDRIRFLKLKCSAIVIQQRFRTLIHAKCQRSKFLLLKTVTLGLQSASRGYLFRQRRWPAMKIELVCARQQLTFNANIIKRALRKQLVKKDRCQFLKFQHAVIVIQRAFRTRRQVRQYQKLRSAAIMVQLKFRTNACKLALDNQQKRNSAASKIQAFFRGFLTRKKLPEFKYQQQMEKRLCAATKIQSFWRGYYVRKKYQQKYQCRREIVQLSSEGAPTLGKRHNDILDVLSKQKRNEYSYKELSTVFWNLDTCTSLSKELCVKTAEGIIVDHIFRFLQYSNQSQPSIEAREPAIRVLNNLLRYHETSWLIWTRTVNYGMVSELIKMMKTSCGKFGTTKKLYCLIATWIWIALQDPKKKQYIQNIPIAVAHFKFMMNTLNKKNDAHKLDKKTMVLPSTRPTWFIGLKCQKCFESDIFATSQICKILNISK